MTGINHSIPFRFPGNTVKNIPSFPPPIFPAARTKVNPPARLPGRRFGTIRFLPLLATLLGLSFPARAAAPNITVPPTNQTVMVGATASFAVTATGTAPLSYQWRRNGVNLANATGTSLTLSNIAPPVAGNYTVVVTNSSGAVTSTPSAVLTVRDTFGYACAETFYSFDDISTNGTRILSNADDEAVSIPFGFNFIFYDRGYSNVVITPNGLLSLGGAEPSSANVNLTNASPPSNLPIIAVLWDDWQTLTNRTPHGEGVYYRMTGTPGSRRFVVQWNNVFGYVSSSEGSPEGVTFQAILLEASRQIVFQYQDVLTGDARTNGNSATIGLRDVDGQLTGKNLQWSCNLPAIQNNLAILFTDLLTDPLIATQPLSRTNVVGSTATFTVTANGSTALGYRWQSNGVNLVNAGNVSGVTTPTLTITSVTTNNAANYTVVVTNTQGMVVSAAATLTVATVPVITSQPLSQTNLLGAAAVFSVAATGFPLNYQWQKNSTNLTDGGRISGVKTATLTLENLQTNDAGVYSVTITNVAGGATSSNATLTILPVIAFPAALDTTGLTWTTGGDATWYGQPLITHDGVDAAQSNDIDDLQTAWLQTTINGPGTLSFWWKVSSEENFDKLAVYLGANPDPEAAVSGEVDWTLQSINLPAGNHVVRWQYSKDDSASQGDDAAWLDQVSFSQSAPPFNLSSVSRLGNAVQFVLNGEVGRSYTIEYSSNLAGWYPLTNFTATNAAMPVLDPVAGNSRRFYRGVTVFP